MPLQSDAIARRELLMQRGLQSGKEENEPFADHSVRMVQVHLPVCLANVWRRAQFVCPRHRQSQPWLTATIKVKMQATIEHLLSKHPKATSAALAQQRQHP